MQLDANVKGTLLAAALLVAAAFTYANCTGTVHHTAQGGKFTYVLYSTSESEGCLSCAPFFSSLAAAIPPGRLERKPANTIASFIELARYQAQAPTILVFAENGRLEGIIPSCLNRPDLVRQVHGYESDTAGLSSIRRSLVDNPRDIEALMGMYQLQKISGHFGDQEQTRRKIEIIEGPGGGMGSRAFEVVDIFGELEDAILNGEVPLVAEFDHALAIIDLIDPPSLRIGFLTTIVTVAQNLGEESLERRALERLWSCRNPMWQSTLVTFIRSCPGLVGMPELSEELLSLDRFVGPGPPP